MNSIKSVRVKIALSLAVLVAVCGCQKHEETPVPPAASTPAIVSAEKTSFDEVTSKLDKGGNLYVYLSTEQALGGLSAKLAGVSNVIGNLPGTGGAGDTVGRVFDVVNTWLADSGIEEINGVGLSSIAREKGFYYSKLVIYHEPGRNQGALWTHMGKAPHPLDGLNMLPEDTVLAVFTDLDVPLIWNDVQSHLKKLGLPAATTALNQVPAQFQQQTGLDWNSVLSSLGGNYGIILTLDPDRKLTLPLPTGTMEFPSPALAIVAKVNSERHLQSRR